MHLLNLFPSPDFQRALPSIFALVVYLFVPWYARQKLNYWRAIQVYERRPADNRPTGRHSNKPCLRIAISGTSIVALLVIVTLVDESGWKETNPLAKNISQAAVTLILAVMTMDVLLEVHQYYPAWTDRKIYRIVGCIGLNNGKVVFDPIANVTQKGQVNADQIDEIIYYATMALTSFALVQAASILKIQANIIPSFYGFLFSLRMYSDLASEFKSCHIAYCNIPTIVIISEMLMNIATMYFEPKRPDSTLKIVEDLKLEPIETMSHSFAIQCCTIAPMILVCFAYRYDLSQAGLDTIEESEADLIVQQSTQEEDQFGRRPILASEVALSSEILSKASFSTFNAAYRTMVLIQIFGILLEVMAPDWVDRLDHLFSESRMLPNKSTIPFPWPILSYYAVMLAMTTSVRRQSINGDTKKLWSYIEVWTPDYYNERVQVRQRAAANTRTLWQEISSLIEEEIKQPIRVFFVTYASYLWCTVLFRSSKGLQQLDL